MIEKKALCVDGGDSSQGKYVNLLEANGYKTVHPSATNYLRIAKKLFQAQGEGNPYDLVVIANPFISYVSRGAVRAEHTLPLLFHAKKLTIPTIYLANGESPNFSQKARELADHTISRYPTLDSEAFVRILHSLNSRNS